MTTHSNTIERKAVNVSGRLGSLYDASTDNLINRYSVQASNIQVFKTYSVCKIFLGNECHDVVDYLKWIEFDDAVQLSILFSTVETSGISSVIHHNLPIHDNIRFLYYSYRSKEEELDLKNEEKNRIFSLLSSLSRATHIITKILWGFEFLCVIPIPKYQSCDTVDNLLRNISIRLKTGDTNFTMTDTETHQIIELTNITVYGSKICIPEAHTSLLTILTGIKNWQRNIDFHHPLKYTMHSLRWIYNNNQLSQAYDLPDEINFDLARIRNIIISIDKMIEDTRQLFKKSSEIPSNPTLNQQWKRYKEDFSSLLEAYKKYRRFLKRTLIDIRRSNCESIEIDKILPAQGYSSLKTESETFYQHLCQEFTKIRLNDHQIQYIQTSDIFSQHYTLSAFEEIEATLKNRFKKEDRSVILWYSSDRLRQSKGKEWEQIFQKLISEREQTPKKTSLIYIDFNQYEQKLRDFAIIKLPIASSPKHRRRNIKECPLRSASSPELRRASKRSLLAPSPPSQRSTLSITEINVLLLGETGVGKSTFINAFVNYLMFDTLQQAEQSEPVVLIPVSFLTTVGDQFEEFMVKFGDADSNEDHEHQGQSVTQQCKSYVFKLNDKLRLRLIDTPGMGDTRGLAQDEKNINHILTYINNLSHLNAICLLFKPNASRLNIFFRSCVNQLLSYLTPIGYGNIMFCFTNARSTFYAPGDTGPLLRQMLKQEHHDDIPFQKENTFCFDSESFRYLAARKRGVKFDEFQSEECIKSWTISVTESVRLLNYIRRRESYHLNEWQSPRKAALEIVMLARPLMETLRLILYMWKLREVGPLDNQIVLRSKFVTTGMCSNCTQFEIAQVGPFHIAQYISDKSNSIQQCRCPFDERHFLIESIVKHEFVRQPINVSIDKFKTVFHDFLFKCDRLTHFLRQKRLINYQDDSFTPVFKRFLDEQQHICNIVHINSKMNKTVQQVLKSLEELREQNRQQLVESNEELSLSQVFELINELKTVETVKQQIKCIKTSRQLRMELNEHKVTIPPIKNKMLLALFNSH